MSQINKPHFCVLPFAGTCIEAGGRFRPCCKYSQWDSSFNSLKNPLEKVVESKSYRKIQKDMLAGVKHEGCQRCWSDEEEGIKSLRQSSNELYQDFVDHEDPKIQVVDFGFGNTCNAACITCDSHSSSKWSEHDEILSKIQHNVFSRNAREEVKESVHWTLQNLKDLRHIIHAQNEVLASKDFFEFLDRLDEQSLVEEKTLFISTNSSIWPSEKVLSKISRFKEVRIQLSIDSVGEENDYIRYPLKWEKVKKIAAQWIGFCEEHQFDINCRSTLSVYNVLSQEKLFDWWQSLSKGKEFNLGYCWYPDYLNPVIFGKTLQPFLKGLELKIPEMKKMLAVETEQKSLQAKFWKFTKEMDRIRGLDFHKTFPGLSNLLLSHETPGFAKPSV